MDDGVKKSHFLGSELVSIRLSGLDAGDKGQRIKTFDPCRCRLKETELPETKL